MQNWNQGYVTDISYTTGYYGTLNPLRIKLCFLAQRLLPPKIETACELGFGQGITLNFNAVSANASWYGTDFNPSQAYFAKNLSQISQAPLKVYNDSFGDFLKRDDLPQFDFIALHGIYSWVSNEVREQILEFIAKKLNIGGVCLISYNCQAGWASVEPLRDLLRTYSNYFAPLGKTSSNRAKEGLDFVNDLMSLPCTQTIKNDKLSSVLATLSRMDNTYLAHEFLNEYHQPFNFLGISQILSKAKLEFASYANFADHLTNIQFLPEEKEILSQVSHNRATYEMVKDLMFATSFRSDYWAKGTIPISIEQTLEELEKLKIVLTIPRSKANFEIKAHRGNFKLSEEFYTPILDCLSQNEPVEVSEIKATLESTLKRKVQFSELIESLIALSSKDYIKLVQEDSHIQASKEYAKNLNSYILKQSLQSQVQIHHLISPITGEAVGLNRFEMMFLYASTLFDKPEEWVKFISDHIDKSGEKLLRDDKELSKEETMEEFQKQAKNIQEWLPLFKKLHLL